ncbi:MAG: DUF59 domain-containing protein [Candidatus Omnitrophica bacterium]|nr:DUF59 domain-containing protein [Candidatus Omnitrophota bacterium]
MITKDQVIDVAKQCFDPEIPVNIWDLGLIYDINITPDTNDVHIRMTLTTQHCPSAKEIPLTLKSKIQAELQPTSVEVEIVFDPLWTPERITEEGKKLLGIEA